MLKTLGAQIKEFKKDSVLTPVFMIGEVIMETIIPLLMASIIDNGVGAQPVLHALELLEGPAGELDDHIVAAWYIFVQRTVFPAGDVL